MTTLATRARQIDHYREIRETLAVELLRELTREQDKHGFLSAEALARIAGEFSVPLYRVEGLASFYTHFRRTPPPAITIQVCRDAVCRLAGACQLSEELGLRSESDRRIEIEEVSCLGQCDQAPAVTRPKSEAEFVDQIRASVSETFPSPRVVRSADGPEEGFRCDPYRQGLAPYSTLRDFLSESSDFRAQCLETLDESGLRGMGGAGFPTARKWQTVADQSTGPKYVICNADESEPGTFKDRVILEQAPHLVVEGMIAAGIAVGAQQGIVYLRHEYSAAREALTRELERARSVGAIGPDAAGSGLPFEIEIFVSPGGYILGEETALLEALEDRRGEPRNKPPYPAICGLYGKPTLINNVETFALAVSILRHGSQWWHDQGFEEFSGLKFVSISGDVECPGVFEVPMGTKLSELVDMCGGILAGRKPLAILPGGASSRFLPADRLDLPLDFDAVRNAGSLLGTAALMVFAEGRNLFDVATTLVRFFRNESCGKCVPCRLGTSQTVEVLEEIQSGCRSPESLIPLEQLERTLQQTSICGLGHVALGPITSMLTHFPDQVPDTDTERGGA